MQKPLAAPDLDIPQRQVPDPGVIPTHQTITPAGFQSVFESRVYGITFGDSAREVYAATNHNPGPGLRGGTLVYKLDWQSNRVLDKLTDYDSHPGLQGLLFDPVSHSVRATAIDKTGAKLLSLWNGSSQPGNAVLGKNEIAQVAISPAGAPGKRYAVAALTFDNQAAIVDLETGTVLSKVTTGIAPFGVVIDGNNRTAFVTNWGGRFAGPGDQTAPSGKDQVVVDERGIASTGTVSRIDLETGTVTSTIAVELHPTSLALDNSRHRLYVANSNSDSISVIDTSRNAVFESISIQPFNQNAVGATPESLALSKDGSYLYVACSGINAVAVFQLKDSQMRLQGMIPTGWYPDAVTLSPDEKYLGVATLLGVGSGWKHGNAACPEGYSPHCKYVHSYRGSIHVIPIPDTVELRRYSVAVAANNHLHLKGSVIPAEAPRETVREMPVPLRAGDPSPIKHIVYIIKENRTYDQFFGGLGKGNGDPSLQQYSEDAIPNHRKLAKDFVLLDNFYATGGNSGDGHQWLTQANETDYVYLPGYAGRSYPWGDDPIAPSSGGFLWNEVLKAGKTFIDFGEFAGYGQDAEHPKAKPTKTRTDLLKDFDNGSTFENMFVGRSDIASLNPYLVREFPGWAMDVPDVARARIFNRYLKKWEAEKSMPDLVMMSLDLDHTAGTSPGFSTPAACMADNDYAVGLMVDAISHSTFWASTLILVVEDDAQDGVDHVDGHRTLAFAISPYIKRGAVDSTFYSFQSMLKTMELILGLKPLTIFDLIATDMRNSFTDKPDLTPYTVQVPKQSLYDVNPPLKALSGLPRQDAEASLRMNFRKPDAVPTEKLNRILWRNAHGTQAAYPSVNHAVFAPYADDDADDDGDEKNVPSE